MDHFHRHRLVTDHVPCLQSPYAFDRLYPFLCPREEPESRSGVRVGMPAATPPQSCARRLPDGRRTRQCMLPRLTCRSPHDSEPTVSRSAPTWPEMQVTHGHLRAMASPARLLEYAHRGSGAEGAARCTQGPVLEMSSQDRAS